MKDFQLDTEKLGFLDNHEGYANSEEGSQAGLKSEPLKRQFATVKEILKRFKNGHGVLLADDVGLGKTTVGALSAWAVALQQNSDGKFCNRVRIYAPNEVMRRRWAEELERHVPMLSKLGASDDRIKQGKVDRLDKGRIQITTHATLVDLNKPQKERKHKGNVSVECDLMIIDEAHRAKGEDSAFNTAMGVFRKCAKRQLILTATPFSIRLAELQQLLQFAGADKDKLSEVTNYANILKRLYSLGDGHDVITESKLLVGAAGRAIKQLRKYLIRHGIDDLAAAERKHFGIVDEKPWDIPTVAATQEDLALLLRMDRILQLAPERRGERRNDPRFHIGWQHLGIELERAEDRADGSDPIVYRHTKAARNSLNTSCTTPHPKVAAVRDAISSVINGGEKVLVFCHHRATASELLGVLERSLKERSKAPNGPEEAVWRAAWESLLDHEGPLVQPIIDWLCSPGIRAQIGGWLSAPADTVEALTMQLEKTRPRNPTAAVPTIANSARTLTKALLDQQSTSTLALLKTIARGTQTFDGKKSHFPGRLDDGLRVMGAWDHDAHSDHPDTLYTGKPDIVLAIFNSPFGPDVLVTTDRLSEGVDLHRCCRHLIHYELDPSPVRTLQRNGRVRRVGSWAALTGQPIQYAYPIFGGTRDEKAVAVMRQRINAFGVLLGGVPSLNNGGNDNEQSFAEAVLREAVEKIKPLNRQLCVTIEN